MHTLRRLRLGRRARAQRQACRVGLGTLLESSPPLRFLTWPAVKSSDSASDWIGPCADAHSCTADRPCTKHCGAPVPSSAAHSVSSWPLRAPHPHSPPPKGRRRRWRCARPVGRPHAPLRAMRRGGAHARALLPSIAALHRLGAAPGAVPRMAC